MSEFQILLTVMISGFGFMGALMLIIWNHFNNGLDHSNIRLDKFDSRINKLEMDMIEVKTILRIIEGNLSTHGHCLFNQSHQEKKAE